MQGGKTLTFIAGNSFSSVSCLPHVILKSKSGFSMSDTCEGSRPGSGSGWHASTRLIADSIVRQSLDQADAQLSESTWTAPMIGTMPSMGRNVMRTCGNSLTSAVEYKGR